VSKKSFSPRVCVSRAARIYNMCLARRVFLQLLCVFFIFFIARACAGAYAAARWFSFNLCGLVLSFIARVIDVLPPGVFLEVVWGGFIPGRACVLLPPPKKSRGCSFLRGYPFCFNHFRLDFCPKGVDFRRNLDCVGVSRLGIFFPCEHVLKNA